MTRFVKEFGKAFLVGIAVFVALLLIQYFSGVAIVSSGKDLARSFFYNQVYAVVYYLSNAYYCNYLISRFKTVFFTPKIIALVAVGIILITIVDTFFIRLFFEVILGENSIRHFIENENFMRYSLPINISIIVTIVFLAFYYYKQKQDTKIAEQQLIAGTASAKFNALKNQLDPHFLFNSLNVLTGLIEENPESATKFTTALSKVYRYVLEQKNKDLVAVTQELDFAKMYLTLLKMRYEDSLELSLPETINNPDAKVVPLSLQLVLENAVKHNIATPEKKLHITIKEVGNELVVTNTLQPKEVLKKGTGVGLQNIRQRYALLTKRPVTISKANDRFTVQLPLLTKQISTMKATQTFINQKKYDLALERVEKIKSFYIHLFIYAVVMSGLIILNILTGHFPWVLFPIIGWGLGILGHASEAFEYHPFFGKKWEQKQINKYLNK